MKLLHLRPEILRKQWILKSQDLARLLLLTAIFWEHQMVEQPKARLWELCSKDITLLTKTCLSEFLFVCQLEECSCKEDTWIAPQLRIWFPALLWLLSLCSKNWCSNAFCFSFPIWKLRKSLFSQNGQCSRTFFSFIQVSKEFRKVT